MLTQYRYSAKQSLHVIVLVVVVTLSWIPCHAQGRSIDKRQQAEGLYVPIHGSIYVEGVRGRGVKVTLYEDNVLLGAMPVNRRGRFILIMDIDRTYSLSFTKPGHLPKLVFIDTTLPKALVSCPAYDLYLNLKLDRSEGNDIFYMDFPSAIIRYDEDRGGFYHSEPYLSHLQSKQSSLARSTH